METAVRGWDFLDPYEPGHKPVVPTAAWISDLPGELQTRFPYPRCIVRSETRIQEASIRGVILQGLSLSASSSVMASATASATRA